MNEGLNNRVYIAPQLRTPRAEPISAPYFYPGDMQLSYWQQWAGAAAACGTASVMCRPIFNCHNFHFIMYVPSVLTAEEKQARFWYQLKTMKWFSYPIPISDQFLGYFVPFALDAVYYDSFQRLIGREKRVRDMRDHERPYNHVTDSGGYTVPFFTTKRQYRWIADGFFTGALVGATWTAMKHPVDVLRHAVTAPDAPKKFSGAFDVLLTSIRHKPGNLLELYKGYPVAAMANAARFSVIFGMYHVWKYEMGGFHPLWFYVLSHITVMLADVAHYPFHKVRSLVVKANTRRRFSQVSVVDVVNELRRTSGITMIFDGFFASRPGFAAVGMALSLTLYDYAQRGFWEQVKPQKK